MFPVHAVSLRRMQLGKRVKASIAIFIYQRVRLLNNDIVVFYDTEPSQMHHSSLIKLPEDWKLIRLGQLIMQKDPGRSRLVYGGKIHMGVSKNRGVSPQITIHFGVPLFLVQHPYLIRDISFSKVWDDGFVAELLMFSLDLWNRTHWICSLQEKGGGNDSQVNRFKKKRGLKPTRYWYLQYFEQFCIQKMRPDILVTGPWLVRAQK